jgi:hypothetical protein
MDVSALRRAGAGVPETSPFFRLLPENWLNH